jgi:hypothetical protein
LDWVREEDDEESYAQRGLARVKAIANADTSFPPETAFLTMRLYRRGDVMVSVMACADDYREEAMRLANEAARALYDSVYPDVALAAQAFVDESIKNVERFASVDVLSLLEAGAGKQLAADQFLSHLLDQTKTELAQTGEVVQRIGWHVHNGMALLPIGTPPFEKYRYFRAVAEVAKKVGAEAVVYVSDGYQLDLNGERTAEEILSVMWINPNATCVTRGVSYTRRKHPQLDHDIITFTLDIAAHESEQNIVPAWGSCHAN